MAKSKRTRQKLDTLLSSATTPVFLLSAARKIVFFNTGCEQLTGWTSDEAVEQVCEYSSDSDPEAITSLARSLCPPPETLRGTPIQVPAYLPHRDGRSLARMIHFFPLSDGEGVVESILGIIVPLPAAPTRREVTPAQRLHAELAALRMSLRQRFGIKHLVGQTDAMLRVLEQVRVACDIDTPLFLVGEPGTGKEHVARVIHTEGLFKTRAFVPLDCRQLDAEQIAQALTRLFDNEPDEGTAAIALRPGTLYLSHVEHLPRDLQERIAARFRSHHASSGDVVRLIAASTTEPRLALEQDRLRSDFYHLVTPLRVDLPPLRNRPADLPSLAQAFVERLNHNADRQIGGFSEGVLDLFCQYNWPGNLDELSAVVQEAWASCAETLIRVNDLPFRFRTGLEGQSVGPPKRPRPMPLMPYLAAVEKEQIQLALDQARQNKSKAAELLGLTRARLYRRMQALGIEDTECGTG